VVPAVVLAPLVRPPVAPVPPVPVPLVVELVVLPQAKESAATASRQPRSPDVIKLFMSSLRFREADFHGHSM